MPMETVSKLSTALFIPRTISIA